MHEGILVSCRDPDRHRLPARYLQIRQSVREVPFDGIQRLVRHKETLGIEHRLQFRCGPDRAGSDLGASGILQLVTEGPVFQGEHERVVRFCVGVRTGSAAVVRLVSGVLLVGHGRLAVGGQNLLLCRGQGVAAGPAVQGSLGNGQLQCFGILPFGEHIPDAGSVQIMHFV